ncbi:hypothetical protein E5161_10435 [Cohnella pontilimi]|uniref:AbiJ-NTD3 domain-containing protein n=1 Tax=Cohnella pontilimi TaxID=2564100 RepID=A0A4U0FGA4_9BACL|nr:hypothetical protein [Cohnella pontilimi]TJY42402.1 hypothetical protein E5161_10435 [Cohnella pontilimi]
MATLKDLLAGITYILSGEKAYNVPSVCLKYGLESGEESEAFQSRRLYVERRLKGKDQLFLIDLAKRIVSDYGDEAKQLARILLSISPNGVFSISEITRRNIMDELYTLGNIAGKYDLIDFLKRIWNLDEMPSTDSRFDTATGDIWQHMINNSDWDDVYLFERYLELLISTDEIFCRFLEQVVHPLIRDQLEQIEYVSVLNERLQKDGYILAVSDNISGFPIYKVTKMTAGVNGRVKNLIFAAIGNKPEIIISDSINNDIKIVKNEKNCLVYDREIPNTGLNWSDLVSWWADLNGLSINDKPTEIDLYKRLAVSLGSDPEKFLFKEYFKMFKDIHHKNFPAIVPQVYLHYDPYTLKTRGNIPVLPRQRMDFLMLFSNKHRIVVEIDGKQHYADDNIASPKKYAEMVKADRELKLSGYEVYRFGGYELMDEKANSKVVIEFFENLFIKHGVKVHSAL